MTLPPPLPEEALHPRTAYVALLTREPSEVLATTLRRKHYHTTIADHFGRGSDVFVLKYLRENMPDVTFISSDNANVIQYLEQNSLALAVRILTIEVHSDGEKGFIQGQGLGKKRQYHYAQYGGVKGKKSSADYVTLGGLESAVDFAQNYLDMIVREEQKQWKQWLEQHPLPLP